MAWRGASDQKRTEKLARLLRTFAGDPIGVGRALPGEFRQWYRWRYQTSKHPHYQVDEAWDEHLHHLLGAAWPCPDKQRLDAVMADITALLAAKGVGSGRSTYAWYSDADTLLCNAVWCVVLHTRPKVAIETGVAHGVTSRIILEALAQNDFGHLSSIDLPFPFDHRLHPETGAAVTDECRPRWSYLEGRSKARLPSLLAEVGKVQVFVHDSLHTAKNTLFEMEQAAPAMSPGGIMVVDDIGAHEGFKTFSARHPDYQTIFCPSEDGISVFGIAVKPALK